MFSKHAVIDFMACAACRNCDAAETCERHAIIREEHDEPPFVLQPKCKGCGDCVVACPFKAIRLVS